MSKLFVHVGDIVTEENLPKEEVARARYTEVLVMGSGRCRAQRIEESNPDIAAALSGINGSIVLLLENIEELIEENKEKS